MRRWRQWIVVVTVVTNPHRRSGLVRWKITCLGILERKGRRGWGIEGGYRRGRETTRPYQQGLGLVVGGCLKPTVGVTKNLQPENTDKGTR